MPTPLAHQFRSRNKSDTLRVSTLREKIIGRRSMASVRYIVADVDKAVEFYRDNLDFKVDMHNPGKFAALLREDLTLYLSAPGAGSGGQAGGNPKPGGWNRFMVVTKELDALIDRLRGANANFRGGISDGGAGRAILLEDPSGNVIELFEFKKH
jgi:catechol 2,3-dioxygenase-like lactoylglutathione lyase family enzyme